MKILKPWESRGTKLFRVQVNYEYGEACITIMQTGDKYLWSFYKNSFLEPTRIGFSYTLERAIKESEEYAIENGFTLINNEKLLNIL